MEPKKPSESYTESVQILNRSTMNGYDRLFGGKLMEWIDVIAAVVARRHSKKNVTTVLVNRLEFKKPAFANDLVVLTGKIVCVGRTSMDICVKSYVEKEDGTRTLINLAYLTLVAIDENGRPTPVPPLAPETDEEKEEYEKAMARRAAIKAESGN